MTDGKGNGRVPPKEHQFQKGESGNPRGRPRKPRRAHIPSQISEDVLAISDMPITIGGEQITIMQAFIRSLAHQAIKGKPSAMRLYTQLLSGALHENVIRNPEFELVDTLKKEMLKQGVAPNKGMEDLLDSIAKDSRKRR